jgi:hypothetical protein
MTRGAGRCGLSTGKNSLGDPPSERDDRQPTMVDNPFAHERR